ncbi:hypothetical protein F2Q68_00016853 [Brassica cretica]|uniref:Aspartic peptidase DDI1-type domain-containing protein n=1 Tax=Brassica cretica TaxID=69181 RepID=A0A8S9HJL7_BRACR|nr:hypothetical protein F2Q68_00016853 [Brassica cretica]
MFCEARERMKKKITLKKKSDPAKFAIPCTVKGIEFPHALCDTGASVSILPGVMADHLGLKVEPSKESFTFVDCSQRISGGIIRNIEVQIVGAVCNMQTNQLCLTLIDSHVHYNPIPVKKPKMSSRGIDDPGLIAACHYGAEYETEYSASIETHTATSIDSVHQKSIDIPKDESVDNDDFWQAVKQEKLQEGYFEVESSPGHRSMTPTESTASCNAVRILTLEELAARHPHPPNPVYVKIDRHSDTAVDRQKENAINRQPPAPINRRAPLTYRVHMLNIDVARLNALRPQPKPSDTPPEATSTHSDDAADSMKVDRVLMGRTLRKRMEKVAKHLQRRANEKKMESFQKETRETEEDIKRMFYEAREKMKKRITLKKKSDPEKFAIPCTVKGIEFPHALCDTGASVSILPRVMADHLGLKVEPSKESFTFVDFSQRISGGIIRNIEVQIVGAVCNMQTNQLCLTLIDPHVHYNPIPVKKPKTSSRGIDDPGLIAACHYGAEYETEYSASIETHTATSIDSVHQKLIDIPKDESVNIGAVCNMQTNQLCLTLIDSHVHYNPIPVKKPKMSSRGIDDPGLIAACHYGAEYETEYSASIETHTATSIDSVHQKSIDIPKDESVDSNPKDWENDYYNPTMAAHTMHTEEYDEDYEEEQAIKYKVILDEEDRLLHHSSWKRNAPSIDRTISTSIDTHLHQTS